MRNFYTKFYVVLLFSLISNALFGQRKMERLGRGVVATRTSNTEALITWRLLGTEPSNLGFNIYRSVNGGQPVKLNNSVLSEGTNWVDATANFSQPNTYFVKAVANNVEQDASGSYTLGANTAAEPFYKIPLVNTPGYYVLHVNVGDVDGDGEYDFVLDKEPKTDQSKPTLVEAYKRDGTRLWQIDLGPNSVNRDNILPGSAAINIGHADNITVYDINNDGKAEVILRTANGVKFADGRKVEDSNNDRQYMSVINGLTGVEISRTLFNNPHLDRGPMSSHLAIAYLDGINPSVVWEAKNRNADNSFNEITTAWDWKSGTLVQKWQYSSLDNGEQMSGHQIRCADIDGDGKDEVIPMGYAIDDDGSLYYSLSDKDIYHGDRFFISDLDPRRPGLEMYGIQQGYSVSGIMWYYLDAKTSEVLFSQSDPANRDMARGYTGDVDPRYEGYEFYTFVDGLYNVSGQKTSTGLPASYPNLRLWWDGDLGSEMLDGTKFTKWNYLQNREDRLYTARNVLLAPRDVPAYYGDIIGDWREEVIYATSDDLYLAVYTTPHPTTNRLYTLPHNPQYRNDMTAKGYNQSYMTSYFLGFNMQPPPAPPIQTADKYWTGTGGLNWDLNTSNWQNHQSQSGNFNNGDVVMFDIRGNSADTIRLMQNLTPKKIWFSNPAGKDYILAGQGKLSGTMDLVKNLDGKVTLAGNHEYTGATIIEEGTLQIKGSLASDVTIKEKGNLGGKGTLTGAITLASGLNTDGGGIRPGLGAEASQVGSLKIQGNLTVPGNNNFSFDIFPGTITLNDSLIVTGNLTVTGINKIFVSFKDDTPKSGTYSLITCLGTLNATKANFVLEGINGVPKEIIVEDNQVKLRIASQREPANVVWKGAVDAVWNFDNRNFDLNNTQTAYVSNDRVAFKDDAAQKNIVLNEAVYSSGLSFESGVYTLAGSGSIGGSGGIRKSPAGSLSILLKGNTYTGKTIIEGGDLIISNIGLAGQPSSLGSASMEPSNISLSNSSVTINENSYTDRGISLAGTNLINIPDTKYTSITGDLLGSGQLIKTGLGAVSLIGGKSYTGAALIKEGSVNLRTAQGNMTGLGPGPITIENATLHLEDVRAYANINWNIIVPEGKNAFLITDGRSTMNGTLTGSGTLNVKTPYVRTDFKGDWSSFTGKLIISGSEFRIANTKGYPDAALHLAEGTMYTISGSNNAVAIGELTGAEEVRASGAAWTIGSKNTDASFAGKITGNSIRKVGTGTWTLTGDNTLSGAVRVSAGRLLVNNVAGKRGLGSGTVTVETGARIGGTGAVKGPIVLNGGAVLEPGNNAIGMLTDSTSVQFNTDAAVEMEIDKNSFSSDKLKVLGMLSFGGKLVVKSVNNQAFKAGDRFTLFEANTYSGNFNTIEPQTPGEGLLWSFSNTTGVLSVVNDPEYVFTLPAKNFAVSVTNETCNSSNNGKISISATENYNYSVTLNGDNAKVQNLTNAAPLTISNLKAGTYTACITIADKAGYQQCYDLVVTEPAALSVYSVVDKEQRTLDLSFSGSEIYQVSVNGKLTESRSGSVSVALSEGNNEVIVWAEKECQGVYKQSVFIPSYTKVYPNPFDESLNILLTNPLITRAAISVYSLNGQRVYQRDHDFNNGQASLTLPDIPSGNYLLTLKTEASESTIKIIKR